MTSFIFCDNLFYCTFKCRELSVTPKKRKEEKEVRKKTLLVVLAFLVYYGALVLGLQLFTDTDYAPTDKKTGFTVLGYLSRAVWDLPDGLYTVYETGKNGGMGVILHKPGPCRNFIYNLNLPPKYPRPGYKNYEAINDLKPGESFQVFKNQVFIT